MRAQVTASRCIAVQSGSQGFYAADEGTFMRAIDCRSERHRLFGFYAHQKSTLCIQGECSAAKNAAGDFVAGNGATLKFCSIDEPTPEDWTVMGATALVSIALYLSGIMLAMEFAWAVALLLPYWVAATLMALSFSREKGSSCHGNQQGCLCPLCVHDQPIA
jgi:hypothetical protein